MKTAWKGKSQIAIIQNFIILPLKTAEVSWGIHAFWEAVGRDRESVGQISWNPFEILFVVNA